MAGVDNTEYSSQISYFRPFFERFFKKFHANFAAFHRIFLLGNWEPVGNTRIYKETIGKLLRFPYMAIGNYRASSSDWSETTQETTEKSINTQASPC